MTSTLSQVEVLQNFKTIGFRIIVFQQSNYKIVHINNENHNLGKCFVISSLSLLYRAPDSQTHFWEKNLDYMSVSRENWKLESSPTKRKMKMAQEHDVEMIRQLYNRGEKYKQ